MREKSKFSKRLRELRAKEDVSCRVLSELCGLPTDAIWRFESGRSKPELDSVVKIAEYFKVSIDFLIGRENY